MNKRIISISSVLLIGLTLLALNRSFKHTKGMSKMALIASSNDSFKNGDIILQTDIQGQGKAIQLATKSKYTHVGILFKIDGIWKVYEAVEPVQCITVKEFIDRDDSGHYTVLRVSNSDSMMGNGKLALIKSFLEQQLNKHYDPYFSWSDQTMYCSELVWKSYNKAGIKLCALRTLKSFDLSSPIVKKIMKERYGNAIPYNEKVVSPEDIYQSKLLEVVAKE